MKKAFFIGSLLISCLTVAQPKESQKDSVILPIEIKGQLLENSNGEPIPYATIQYGQNKGVISNEEGRFRFFARSTACCYRFDANHLYGV